MSGYNKHPSIHIENSDGRVFRGDGQTQVPVADHCHSPEGTVNRDIVRRVRDAPGGVIGEKYADLNGHGRNTIPDPFIWQNRN